jgi:hypothetical protein
MFIKIIIGFICILGIIVILFMFITDLIELRNEFYGGKKIIKNKTIIKNTNYYRIQKIKKIKKVM